MKIAVAQSISRWKPVKYSPGEIVQLGPQRCGVDAGGKRMPNEASPLTAEVLGWRRW
jgi:hypothetical protein